MFNISGFRYIKHVSYIRSASFSSCQFVDDDALIHLHGSADTGSLKVLNLSKTRISPFGIRRLAELKSLKHLDISDCKGITDLELGVDFPYPDVLEYLKSELPKCTIVLHSDKVLQEKV